MKPFIHLFQVGRRCFCYDVNKNQILEIPERVYRYLEMDEAGSMEEWQDAEVYVEELKAKGFLSSSCPQISEHSATEYYSALLENNLGQITLQVTQKCNLDCEYCVYSENSHNRHHADRWMSMETAKKAIQYLLDHSSDVETPALSFYGGEPLLAFDLIKECTLYAEKIFEGRKVLFNFTTNGTLLSKDKVDFLVQHGFTMLISLDGPEEVHNRHRLFAVSSIGSFKLLMTNVKYIKERYPSFFKENVTFNTVIDPRYSIADICEFACNNEVIRDSAFMASVIDDTYADKKVESGKRFKEEYAYEKFKVFLMMTGRLDQNKISPLMRGHFVRVRQMAAALEQQQDKLPRKGHRGGTCIAGANKLFVTVDGDFYPCEQVSESSRAGYLGNLEEGINTDKALSILNIEKISSERCRHCWGYSFCTLCVAQADDGQEMTDCKLCQGCGDCRNSIEGNLQDYVILRDYGYKSEIK